MTDFIEQNDPTCNRQFNRRWGSNLPLSAAERRLEFLRRTHGNIEGTAIHARECAVKQGVRYVR